MPSAKILTNQQLDALWNGLWSPYQSEKDRIRDVVYSCLEAHAELQQMIDAWRKFRIGDRFLMNDPTYRRAMELAYGKEDQLP